MVQSNQQASGANTGFGGMNPMYKAAFGGLAGGTLANSLFSLFGGNKNPADAASSYYNQIPGMMTPYYQPYINAGQQALPALQQQYMSLLQNPGALMKSIGGQFQQSPGFKFSVDQATNAANNAAAAGGMVGSPAEQAELSKTVTGLANQDYYNYLNQALGLYGQGLSGMGNLNQMGYNASTGLAENLANALMSQGNLAYSGQANQNQSQGGMWGDIGSLIGGLASIF